MVFKTPYFKLTTFSINFFLNFFRRTQQRVKNGTTALPWQKALK
jgi:hypothetical protein